MMDENISLSDWFVSLTIFYILMPTDICCWVLPFNKSFDWLRGVISLKADDMKTSLVTAGAVHRYCSCYIIFSMFPQLLLVLEAEVRRWRVIGWFSVAANHTSSLSRAAFAAFAFVPSANWLIIFLFKCILTLSQCNSLQNIHELSSGFTVFR